MLTFQVTVRERIPRETIGANARRRVVDDVAGCGDSAGAWTRIPAPFIHAGLTTRAIGVDGALGSAVRRTTDVRRETGARWRAANVATLRVRSAWRRYARILNDRTG